MTPERRDEIALRVVSVVVVGSLALALAGLTWRLTGWDDGRDEVAVAETLAPLGGAATQGADADVARIVSLAPFGGATAAGGVPASTLGLVLKGILMADPPSASTALIAVGEGPAAIYGVGQTPVGDAVIEAIEVDHVILSSGGARQRLDFPEPVAVDPATVSATPGAGITVTPVQPAQSAEAAAALAMSSPVASAAAAAQQAPRVADAGATPNVAAAAGAAGVTATAAGYRIGPNPSPELRRFGLQPGDVIETLNGQAVGGAANDQQLIERARSAGQARVVILREGRRLTVNLPLR
ncbi:type II secretion system protein N [Brevundimonas sp.]|uniref:type II secretion system protein N n=1 Tax=Brevundimonas sp. TaxID=1871086 RepID=UPI00286AFCDD|nr:type II secretion system protein N [Brevundimonas sp.]